MAANKQSATKSNPWLWVLLLVTLLLTVYLNLQTDVASDEIELSEPAQRTKTTKTNRNQADKHERSREQVGMVVVTDDLIPLDLLDRDQGLKSVGNAFVSRSWYVPPPPPPEMEEEFEPEAPKAPAVPFKYIGKFDEYQIYLQEGDKLYTVEVGDTIKGVWRIESDEPTRIELTYLPLNQQKILNKH